MSEKYKCAVSGAPNDKPSTNKLITLPDLTHEILKKANEKLVTVEQEKSKSLVKVPGRAIDVSVRKFAIDDVTRYLAMHAGRVSLRACSDEQTLLVKFVNVLQSSKRRYFVLALRGFINESGGVLLATVEWS
ncbi:hypothetical protein PHJA_000850300 [Phtheirospermum japonicum]|uniref:Uncharacterized protein n=1 Tax=Phtheirospermum japonicum TaxID=374723 RepID=A0A830BTW4_9LAMI|nr:hypothetical protein PHJA_000850300 [Phtheirospermum japonicum]